MNDQTLTDTYTQRYMKNITKIIIGRRTNQLENKILGVDVKPKRKIPDVSLIEFWEIGTRIPSTP